MVDWVIFVLVFFAAASIVVLAVSGALTWLFEWLGLSGKSDIRSPDADPPVGLVRSPFVSEPGHDHATGTVEYRGELWTARCDTEEAMTLKHGTRCRIIKSQGLTLLVSRDNEQAV